MSGAEGLDSGGPELRSALVLSKTREPSAATEMSPPRHPQPGDMEAGGTGGGRWLQVKRHTTCPGLPRTRLFPARRHSVIHSKCLETCVPRSQLGALGWGWGCGQIGDIDRAWLLREKWGSVLEKAVKVSGPSGSVGVCERGWKRKSVNEGLCRKSIWELFLDQILM